MKDYQLKVLETLDSLNGIQRAEAKPFLFTRIQARLMDEAEDSFWSRAVEFFSKPVTIAFLVLSILIMNYFIINSPVSTNDQPTVSGITLSDYSLNVASYYNLENE